MLSRLLFLLLSWTFAVHLGHAQKLPGVKKPSLKVQINATSDTVILKFLRPSPNINLEGFILGYGSSFFSSQYIPLPVNGKTYDTELDAEPRYLITVRPSPVVNAKKTCSGQAKVQKPLHVVVGTLSPTSVFLAWGILINPQYDWTVLNNCPNDRFYTVRYREKEKNKKWHFQLCPNTETVIDNLKPNIIYEYGVKVNSDDGIWNKGVTHKTTVPAKHKGIVHAQSTIKEPKGHIQMAPENTKVLVPVTIIKQVIQNVSIPKKSKSTEAPLLGTTPAVNDTQPLLLISGASEEPEIPKATESETVTDQIIQEPLRTKTFVTPEQPDATPAKHQGTQEPPTMKTFIFSEQPKSELATHEVTQQPLTSKTISPPEQPDSTPATQETNQEQWKTVTSVSPEQPDSTPEKHLVTQELLTVNTFISTEQPISKLAPTYQITQEPLKTKSVTPHEQPDSTPAKHQVTQEPLTTKTFISTLQPDSKRAKQQITQEPHKTKTLLSSQRPDTTTETRQMTQEPPADITFISPEQPDATPVSNEPTAFPFKDDASAALEIQESRPASTSRPIQESTPPKSSQTREQPKATLALNEIPKPKSSERPAIPQSSPVYRTSPQPLTTKPSPARKRPKATRVPKDPLPVPSKLDTTVRPDGPKTKPVPKPTRWVPINIIRVHIADTLRATLVPPEVENASPSKPKTPKMPHWEAVPNEIHKFSPSKPKPPQTTERPRPTAAPKKTQWAPINLIQVHIFGDLNITSVPNETQKMPPSRPKPVHPTARPRSRAVPKSTNKSTHSASINLIRLQIFDDSRVALVPNETQKTTSSKPTSQTADIPHVKPAFIESLIDAIKSNISIPHRKPEPTLAPKRVHPSSSRPKTSARPRTRPVPYKTTPGTVRTKPSNDLNWISGRLTDQDITKLLGVSRNTSLEPNGTMKKAASGALPSVTQRVPLAPARPTHMRRRPLPPNSVTGRPGISGNGLMPRAPPSSIKYRARPTRIPIVERTQPPKEKPTLAPEPETVTEPVFNDNPVSEVDSQGKPRYTAPHVKYIRKEDMVPCSITESVKHFPTEFATNQDEATNAPQNPPSNLTVVAVEGCSSFVILDWKQPDNETITEYKIISKENGGTTGNEESISTTNQTHSTVENLKPDTSYEFKVVATNSLGESPPSTTVTHNTESADPRVSELITGGGKDAIWTEIKFKSDSYSECKGKQYVKRTWYKKFVGIQLCNSLRYKIYLGNSLLGRFYNIGDESGYGEDHCQFVDSFLDGRTGQRLLPEQLPSREGFYRAVRQQPVEFGKMGTQTHIRYVHWYECGTAIPGKW